MPAACRSRQGPCPSIISAQISSSTFASGKGGTVAVAVDGLLAIDGSGTNPDVVATGIVTNSLAGSSGNAGDVSVQAGALSIINGGSISSALRPFMNLPASTGNSGSVTVNVGGLLSLSGSGSRIGTETNAGSTGNAGSITVNAGQITLANGGEIISTTAGTGAGGSVTVTTPGGAGARWHGKLEHPDRRLGDRPAIRARGYGDSECQQPDAWRAARRSPAPPPGPVKAVTSI